MSMKSLPYPHRHNCPRENCQGHAKDFNNYLHLTKTKPKSKPSKTARSFNSLHEKIVKQKMKPTPKSKPSKHEISERGELDEQRRRNEELEQLLQEKSKKINQMKNHIKDFEGRLKNSERRQKEWEEKARQYEMRVVQLQAVINDNQYPKSPISLERPTQSMMSHYQQQLRLLQVSQKATLDAVEKCRLIEKEFHEYRSESERKVERLVRENEQLRQFEPEDKAYSQEISSLRKELHRLSQTQHSPSVQHTRQETVTALKTQVRQLIGEKQNMDIALREKQESCLVLRRNLQAINRKVDRWNEQYKQMIEERRVLQERYNDLLERHSLRKQRQMKDKEEWASIFREVMQEVERLKREISRLQKISQRKGRTYTDDDAQ